MRILVQKFFVFCVQVSLFLPVFGEKSRQSKEFTNFESNLGEQRLVDEVRLWVGVTPMELAPNAVVLGSLKNRSFVPAESLQGDVGLLIPGEKKEKPQAALPKNVNYPRAISNKAVPKKMSTGGWVGPLPHELAPRVIPLGSLANRRKVMQRVPDTNEPTGKIARP